MGVGINHHSLIHNMDRSRITCCKCGRGRDDVRWLDGYRVTDCDVLVKWKCDEYPNCHKGLAHRDTGARK